MQKPSKLAQIPRIRFAGFTDPWERRKLGITKTFFYRWQLWRVISKGIRYGR